MKISDLKVGDKVRIKSVPGEGVEGYTIHKETVRAYKKLIARNRPVTISEIDEHGQPWYNFRLKKKDKWHFHSMVIMGDDNNWAKVKPRKK